MMPSSENPTKSVVRKLNAIVAVAPRPLLNDLCAEFRKASVGAPRTRARIPWPFREFEDFPDDGLF